MLKTIKCMQSYLVKWALFFKIDLTYKKANGPMVYAAALIGILNRMAMVTLELLYIYK
jgi:hypothetical protein